MIQQLETFINNFLIEKFGIQKNVICLKPTNKNFEGDYSFNVFQILKQLNDKSLSPTLIYDAISTKLSDELNFIDKITYTNGFINISISDSYLLSSFKKLDFIYLDSNKKKFLIEYCSPNTNKPLHLGHVRNILIGYSLSQILKFAGHDVITTNLLNDRGIHICKPMLAYIKWGNNATPNELNIKGDKFVGNFYVLFENEYKKQVNDLLNKGYSKEFALREAPIIKEAQELLKKWEQKDEKVLTLWNNINNWVIKGFVDTFEKLNLSFYSIYNKIYKESEIFEFGKQIIYDGLKKGIFQKKQDGTIYIDLTDEGLDEKVLLRPDETSLYITQDIALAILRYEEFKPDIFIYVVGNEQNYHFKVLKAILKKLNFPWYNKIFHLAHGMIELPTGKMKSREGTVIDADDLIQQVYNEAKIIAKNYGKLELENETEFNKITYKIALAALKYFILKIDPFKNVLYDAKNSVDFDGNTGSFILYTYARINSLLKKSEQYSYDFNPSNIILNKKERELILHLYNYYFAIYDAVNEYNPAKIANYVYALCKEYNNFYQEIPILKEPNPDIKNFRLYLSLKCALCINKFFNLLGIETVEKM